MVSEIINHIQLARFSKSQPETWTYTGIKGGERPFCA